VNSDMGMHRIRGPISGAAKVRIADSAAECMLAYKRLADGSLIVDVGGNWDLRSGLPLSDQFDNVINEEPPIRIAFECSKLGRWDSSLLTFLHELTRLARQRHLAVDTAGLPAGVRRLLELSGEVPETKDAHAERVSGRLLAQVGGLVIGEGASIAEALAFIGQVTTAALRLLIGRPHFRESDFSLVLQECGVEALGVVTLIAFLVEMILAFMGAVQLLRFGPSIYVADMMGIGVVREMGAVMTGVIMAGRTGAAFAAQLGTMKVTQEIDALTIRWHFADGIPGPPPVHCPDSDDAAAVHICRRGGNHGRRHHRYADAPSIQATSWWERAELRSPGASIGPNPGDA